jgi:hypothetical protein
MDNSSVTALETCIQTEKLIALRGVSGVPRQPEARTQTALCGGFCCSKPPHLSLACDGSIIGHDERWRHRRVWSWGCHTICSKTHAKLKSEQIQSVPKSVVYNVALALGRNLWKFSLKVFFQHHKQGLR